jgi:hypothetical protein
MRGFGLVIGRQVAIDQLDEERLINWSRVSYVTFTAASGPLNTIQTANGTTSTIGPSIP